MSNSKGTPLATVIGISVLCSAVSVGISIQVGSKMNEAYVQSQIEKLVTEQLPGEAKKALDTSLNDRVPQEVIKAIKQIEEEKIASKVKENLGPWSLAHAETINGRHIYGSPEAEFTLVEFSDLECGYCKRLHQTPKVLVEQAKGKINWEWHHFPLQFHDPIATTGAEAAECVGEIAGNTAFWAFTDQWFKNSQMNGQGVESISSLAVSVGAEAKAFTECLNSGKYLPVIKKQIEKGIQLGVTGTPGTFVVDNTTGNRLLVKGAQPPQAFLEAIEKLVTMRAEAPTQESAPAVEATEQGAAQ